MNFTTDDVAPVGGTYSVLTADGVRIGHIILDTGAKFPPAAIPTQYYDGPV